MNKFKASVAIVSASFVASALAGCAEAGSPAEEATIAAQDTLSSSDCPPGVPAAINPPAGETLKFKLSGVGVQIYECNAVKNSSPTTFAWSLVAPQANLYNDDGKLVGTHFIGPTWQGHDGSSVQGAKVAGATVDASAIPWLLLKATGHASVDGRFDDVTSVQRLSTVGGLAPTDTCDITTVGTIAQVPYTAEYFFYRAKPTGKVNQCTGS